MTLTDTETSCKLSSRLVAVTTIFSNSRVCWALTPEDTNNAGIRKQGIEDFRVKLELNIILHH
jgi:hypothetical protein